MQFAFETNPCPVCGAGEFTPRQAVHRYEQGALQFVTCRRCESAYQRPRPNHDSMQAFYSSEGFFRAGGSRLVGFHDHDQEVGIRTRTGAARLRELERMFPRRKLRILDVACGYAAFVRLARAHGHDATGIDYSPAMVSGAKAENGVDVVEGDFLTHDFRGTIFDVVLLYGALQNFLDLGRVIEAVARVLAPDGLYCTNTIVADSWLERRQGERFWNYRPPIVFIPSMQGMIDEHRSRGLALVRKQRERQVVTPDKCVTFLLNRPLRLPGGGTEFPLIVPTGYWRFFFRRGA